MSACVLCNALLGIVLLATPICAQYQKTMFPPVRGTREMVGAANNFEVEAGFRLLAQGGNAVDAGVAATLTAAVTEQSRFGLGGEMPLLVKMRGKRVVVVSGVGRAPTGATVDYYRTRKPEPWEDASRMAPIPSIGIRAAVTPGVFDGLLLALDKYGTRSFAQVVAPAIEYAEGFPIPEEFASFIERDEEVLELWPTSKKLFMPKGRPPERGELVRLKPLVKTLKALVAVEAKTKGSRSKKLQAVRDLFYRGKIGRQIADFSVENGGLITREDMANFQAEIDVPASTSYRGYSVNKPGFWSQGPVLLQALNILESYDLKGMGHNSREYLHTLVEAMTLAMADRDRYYGDPDGGEVPAETLLSKKYAERRRAQIDPKKASMDHRPGTILPAMKLSGGLSTGEASGEEPWVSDTTCVNVVDRKGNVFSATPSGAWLPSVIAGGTGIPLSTRLQSFVLTAGHANRIAPGKRQRITLSPKQLLKDRKQVFALSTPGGDNQDQAALQVLLNIIEFGMSPQEAVEAPRFQSYHLYGSFGGHEFSPGRLALEDRIPSEVAAELKQMGHRVSIRGPWSNSSAPTIIHITDGVLHGGADPRRSRFIFGR